MRGPLQKGITKVVGLVVKIYPEMALPTFLNLLRRTIQRHPWTWIRRNPKWKVKVDMVMAFWTSFFFLSCFFTAMVLLNVPLVPWVFITRLCFLILLILFYNIYS